MMGQRAGEMVTCMIRPNRSKPGQKGLICRGEHLKDVSKGSDIIRFVY